MAEAKQPDKINEFMQGFLKYIVDKEKKDEEDFRELNEELENKNWTTIKTRRKKKERRFFE